MCSSTFSAAEQPGRAAFQPGATIPPRASLVTQRPLFSRCVTWYARSTTRFMKPVSHTAHARPEKIASDLSERSEAIITRKNTQNQEVFVGCHIYCPCVPHILSLVPEAVSVNSTLLIPVLSVFSGPSLFLIRNDILLYIERWPFLFVPLPPVSVFVDPVLRETKLYMCD
jgi:hypothetical protein